MQTNIFRAAFVVCALFGTSRTVNAQSFVFDRNIGYGNGSGRGQLNYPFGVATDSSGSVFVADYYNGRIQKFKGDGSFVRTIVSSGKRSVDCSFWNHCRQQRQYFCRGLGPQP